MKIELKLNNQQESQIVAEWGLRPQNPPSVSELIKLVFHKDNLDGRSAEGIVIRKFLSDKCLNNKVKDVPTLTEDDKEFIKNNYDKMTGPQMSRIIFKNKDLLAGHPETRLVLAYKNSLDPSLTYKDEKILKEFKAPQKDEQVIKLVNSIVLNGFNPDKVDGATKKCLISCVAYFNNERFLTDIERYQEPNERKMFINNFIRHVYDKPDLTQQDLDIMILFSKEVIEEKRIEDQMALLRKNQEVKDGDEEIDTKMSMSLVEMINNCTNNLNKSKKVQSDLLKEINEKRSDRLKKERSNTSSLLNLVAEWIDEENRLKIIKLAEERKAVLGDEIDKMSDLDDFKARILGVNKEELLYGSN